MHGQREFEHHEEQEGVTPGGGEGSLGPIGPNAVVIDAACRKGLGMKRRSKSLFVFGAFAIGLVALLYVALTFDVFQNKDKELTTLSPKGPTAASIQTLNIWVFGVAALVFVLVFATGFYIMWRFRDRARTPTTPTTSPSRSTALHARDRLDDPARAVLAASASPPSSRCSTWQGRRRRRRAGRGRSASSGGGSTATTSTTTASYDDDHHRQRPGDPGRARGRPAHHVERRDPLLLGPGAQRQEGRRARPHRSPLEDRGRRARASTAASAPSSAASPTPTCASRSSR